MSEHTPGPWTTEKEGSGGIIVKRGALFDDAICRIVTAFAGAEDNARLIAAAPDLLAAAKEMIPAIGKLRGVDLVDAAHDLAVEALNGPEDRLLAAIVKAEGRL